MQKKDKIIKWTLIAIFIGFAAWGLRSEAAELGVGLSKAVSHGSEWTGQHLQFVHKDWYIEAAKLGGEDRLPDTFRYSSGFRIDWREKKEFSPFLKLGMAYFKEEPAWIISDRWSYDMSLGVRFFKVLDLEFNHNSTAGRTDFNKGNDLINLYLVKEFK